MNEILERVKNQYERFPYPHFSWLSRIKPQSVSFASFETGMRLIFEKTSSHQGKKIALLGCGTSETLAFANSHKKAHLTAIDLSAKAIKISKIRCALWGQRNVDFFNEDLIAFQNRGIKFDYVHCYGVLHHLPDPLKGFQAIKNLLTSKGFARIMVYSQQGRMRIQLLQKALKQMNFHFQSPTFEKDIRQFINTLPWENPLRLTFELHPEVKNKNGLVDSFLHSNERVFSLRELKNLLNQSGLHIGAWDFSKNILNLLKDAEGKNIEEKIEMLEAFDQWPSHFSFWVSHQPTTTQKINLKP